MENYKEAVKKLGASNINLFKQCPEVAPAFMTMHDKVVADGALDEKQKELIALGIAICIRCEGCIYSHVNTLVDLGVTLKEIAETVEVSIMMGGGPSTVYGGKALECAQELLG